LDGVRCATSLTAPPWIFKPFGCWSMAVRRSTLVVLGNDNPPTAYSAEGHTVASANIGKSPLALRHSRMRHSMPPRGASGGHDTQAPHEASTSSTSDRARPTRTSRRVPTGGRHHVAGRACRDPARRPPNSGSNDRRRPRHTSTSRGLDKLDQRSAPTHTHVTTRADRRTPPRRWSSLSRPRTTTSEQRQQRPTAAPTHKHLARSRQARPARGHDTQAPHDACRQADATTPLVEPVETPHDDLRTAAATTDGGHDTQAPREASTSSTSERARHTRTSRRVPTGGRHHPAGRACRDPARRPPNSGSNDRRRARHTSTSRGLDKLDQRSVTPHTHVTTRADTRTPPRRWSSLSRPRTTTFGQRRQSLGAGVSPGRRSTRTCTPPRAPRSRSPLRPPPENAPTRAWCEYPSRRGRRSAETPTPAPVAQGAWR